MSAHGPDAPTTERAMTAELAPHKVDDTLAFMFETSQVIRPTVAAMAWPSLHADYDACWVGLSRRFGPR
jgi:homogentisate 1,2-dioxygenase